MKLLKRESPLDLSELKSMLEKANLPQDAILLVNLSGRGDKDVAQVARLMGADLSGTGEER